ncbi:MAG: hypothetical protein A2927_00460 [Candidatus Komeilibacteria bacterium RIFCSPLOWO2_01_FULL_45_10]|uniref:Uncharacterized protein n=1 Tax=Candidatus Komeilibacteria bacterium RIFCSPLOWO2_01_FULL_45_10 TaxID=1798550 RepID=A0A1G2BJM1_9BACT|nr:MAG: hypothetical protein A2927_00460 [Candidatus Komeilibacteria bacterium RIFCSPLOWO2_01_FULL_45_10]
MKKKAVIRINPNIVLSVLLLLGMAFSVIQIVKSAAQNPGHAWSTLDDSTAPITKGGTGETTANNAFNALAPSQSGNSGKFLTTNGPSPSWATYTITRSTTTHELIAGRSSASLTADSYCDPSGSVCATTANASLATRIPFAATLRNLYIFISASQISTDDCDYYLRTASGACPNLPLTGIWSELWGMAGQGGREQAI